AQSMLGSMYVQGKGVAQDYKQAVAWTRKAAEQGNAKAQLLLGVMYDNGVGVVQDNKLAYVWGSPQNSEKIVR
ncbi:tetratricopeptide repeat protein, partial [Aeromonas veronii]